MSTAKVEFCGEIYDLDSERVFTIGREGDLVIDSNPFLHRRFLELSWSEHLWWLNNVGSQLSVTLAEPNGRLNAWLAPGARIPLVFSQVSAWFTAGPTTYEIVVTIPEPPYEQSGDRADSSTNGATTLGPVNLSPEQMRVVLALSEPTLRRARNAASEIPSSADAARRLQWTLTKFNRKIRRSLREVGPDGRARASWQCRSAGFEPEGQACRVRPFDADGDSGGPGTP